MCERGKIPCIYIIKSAGAKAVVGGVLHRKHTCCHNATVISIKKLPIINRYRKKDNWLVLIRYEPSQSVCYIVRDEKINNVFKNNNYSIF